MKTLWPTPKHSIPTDRLTATTEVFFSLVAPTVNAYLWQRRLVQPGNRYFTIVPYRLDRGIKHDVHLLTYLR